MDERNTMHTGKNPTSDFDRLSEMRKRDTAALAESMAGVAGNQANGPVADCGQNSTGVPLSERLSLNNIDDAMKYQPWRHDQFEAGDIVREALTAAAKAILRVVPDSPYRTVALRNVLDARMNANAAISFRGRF